MPEDCTCCSGAPVGWRRIEGGGICAGFGGACFGSSPCGPFGCGSGGMLNANQNVNINNNTNNNTNHNANQNTSGSSNNMFGGLLNNFGSMFPGCVPMGGGGIPGFGSGNCCGPTSAFPPMPPLMPNCGCCCDTESCNDPCRRGFCVRNFRIISPDGRECSFPVAMPWWACGPTGGVAPAAGAVSMANEPMPAAPEIIDIPAAVPASVQAEERPRRETCMTASQLLMQRYMLDQPPRNTYEPRHAEPMRYTPQQPNDDHYMPPRVYRDVPEYAE